MDVGGGTTTATTASPEPTTLLLRRRRRHRQQEVPLRQRQRRTSPRTRRTTTTTQQRQRQQHFLPPRRPLPRRSTADGFVIALLLLTATAAMILSTTASTLFFGGWKPPPRPSSAGGGGIVAVAAAAAFSVAVASVRRPSRRRPSCRRTSRLSLYRDATTGAGSRCTTTRGNVDDRQIVGVSTSRLQATGAARRRRDVPTDGGGGGGGTRRSKTTTTSSDDDALSWERFEFGDSPKWDRRFDDESCVGRGTGDLEEIEATAIREAELDAEAAAELEKRLEAWERLDPFVVQKAIDVLKPYVTEARFARIESVLKQRTRRTRFLFENPANPSNVWACLRTLESFGIQHVDVVIESGRYKGKAALSQKRGMRTAMGSAQWLTLRNHRSTSDALRAIRGNNSDNNCLLLASDVNPDAQDIRSIDWANLAGPKVNGESNDKSDDDDRPICIVMGNEETGISDEMRKEADGLFYLPMVGFAESFNLSVATAITLAYLSAASSPSSSEKNALRRPPIRPGDLPKAEYDCLVLKGLLNSVPKRRIADALLRKEGIVLPNDDVRLL